jgi:hypothetical protein
MHRVLNGLAAECNETAIGLIGLWQNKTGVRHPWQVADLPGYTGTWRILSEMVDDGEQTQIDFGGRFREVRNTRKFTTIQAALEFDHCGWVSIRNTFGFVL